MTGPPKAKERQAGRRWWRIAGLGLGGLALLVIGVIVAGLAWLDSAPGKRWLITVINQHLQADGIKAGPLTGALYSDFRSEHLIFSDKSGPYLRLQDIHITWKVLALFKGRLEIQTLTIDEAHLLRLPQDESPTLASSPTFKRPALPDLPVDIAITGLAVPRILVAEDIWDVGAVLSASAQSFYLSSHIASLDAVLARLDHAEKDAIAVRLEYDASQGDLMLSLDASSEPGGLFTSILSAKAGETFSLKLQGDGPLESWSGQIFTHLGERLYFDGTLISSGTRLSLQGKARQSGFVPAPYANLLDPETALTIEADIASADRLPLALSVRNSAGSIKLDGHIVPENADNLALSYEITLDDPNRLSGLIDDVSLQSASLKGTLSGTVDALRMEAALAIISPIIGDAGTAAAITANITAKRDGPVITATIASETKRVVLKGLDPFTIGLTATMHYDETRKRLFLDQAKAVLPGATTTSQGWLSLDDGLLSLKTDLIAGDLAALPYPLPVSGALQAIVNVEKTSNDDHIMIALDVNGQDMTTSNETIDALLAPDPRMTAQAEFVPDKQRLAIHKMSLDTPGLTLEAKGETQSDGRSISLAYALHFHDLAQIMKDIPLVAAGGLTVTGTLSGAADALTVTADSRVEQVDIQNILLRNLHLSAQADGLGGDMTALVLKAGAQSRFGPLQLDTQAMMAEDGAIALPTFLMRIGAARLNGTLDRAADGLISGVITGTSGSLAELDTSSGTGLRGNLTLDIRLDAEDGAQRVRTDIDANKLVLPMGNNELLEMEDFHISSDFQLTDALPLGHARLEAADMRMGFTRLTQIVITADGSRQALHIDGYADGEWRGALGLEGGLVWQMHDVGQIFSLDLDGTLFGQTIETPEAITANVNEDAWRINPFRLTVANGHIDGTAAKGADQISASLLLEDLPLELINIMAPRMLPTGTLSAELALEQSGDTVEVNLAAALDNVAPAYAGFAQTPPMAVHLTADLADRHLRATGAATAQDAVQAEYSIDLPVMVNLLEGTVALAEDAPLKGNLTWHGALAPLFMIFNLPRHEASGDLDLDIALAGTLADPHITGSIALHDVRYEHLDSGFVATDLILDARLNDRRLTIDTLTGRDGNSGLLKGEGWAVLTESGAIHADIGLVLDNMTVARRVDVTAVTSADLRLQLTEKDMRASGSLSPDRADVDIGRSVPSDIVTINVVELRTTEDGNTAQAGAEDQANETPLLLDFKVEAPRRIFIRGRGLDSEWEAHLDIGGTAQAPILSGTAGLLKGSFDFAGRRFTLDGGQIIFTGAQKIDPLLDIKAREQMNGHDVTLTLTGPSSQPSISLSATPPLPEDEILSRLLFGESIADLSPLQAVQLASALSTLSGGGGLDLVGATRSALGLDRLNIDMPGDDAAGTRITGGKYLTDDVYFEVSTETGSGITRGTLEWALTKSLSLRSRMSSGQDNSISLRWSWRY